MHIPCSCLCCLFTIQDIYFGYFTTKLKYCFHVLSRLGWIVVQGIIIPCFKKIRSSVKCVIGVDIRVV